MAINTSRRNFWNNNTGTGRWFRRPPCEKVSYALTGNRRDRYLYDLVNRMTKASRSTLVVHWERLRSGYEEQRQLHTSQNATAGAPAQKQPLYAKISHKW